MKSLYKTLVALCVPVLMTAQSAKVQTAWRQLQDYESSKDVSSLMKAKEAIDLATTNDDTKEKAKTWVYRAKIYYALFRNALEQEEKKLAASISDKNERVTKAYGNVSTVDYEEAGKAMEKAVNYDKDKAYQQDYGIVGMQMMGDVNNLAVGKYNVGKFAEAAEFFEASYLTTKMMGKKDTASLTNALVCAQKAKDQAKVKEYNEKIIAEKVATAYNYNSLYDCKLALKDSAGALTALKDGRAAFPNDADLLNRETEYYLVRGKDTEALANLDKAIEKQPTVGVLWLARGSLYDKQANPVDAARKELPKPKNFDELMGKAETNYKKATEIDPKNADSWYNLGALYNNWGGVESKRCDDLVKQAAKLKECEALATDRFNKAIPALEKALEFHPGDRSIMVPLRKLYLLTNQSDKAQKMSDAMNKK